MLISIVEVLCVSKKKITIFRICGKKGKNSLQVRIAYNNIMSHNKAIEQLCIEIGGVQCIIPVLWAIDQPYHDMIIGNDFQRLYSLCTQSISQKNFTINGHSVLTNELNKACIHQKLELTWNRRSEKVIPT